jgi:DNA-binding SARP family transcriptional activator/predicted ATPase
MARFLVRLLGPFQVTLAGEPVTAFESDKVRALLAYLAVERDRPQRRERLAGLLWPERSESVARANLRVALADLRSVIGDRRAQPPFLCITRQTLQLNPESDTWIDVAAFADRAAVPLHGPPDLQRLEQAVEIYRGGFLEGFSLPDSAAFEEWVVLTRERLALQMLTALQSLAGTYEAQGALARALPFVRRQIDLDPWDEQAQRQLMRLLAHTGQRNAALAQYDGLRRTLAEELGVEPEDETAALYHRIREGTLVGLQPGGPPHNLPAPLTPFVGRQAEVSAIVARLRDPACRLLTLIGPGGSGKTRLALAAARQVLHEGREPAHGIYFVPLAALASAADLVVALANILAFPLRGERPPQRQLIDYLRPRRVLLVLDNWEHLLTPQALHDDGLDWLVALLRAAPGVRVLATSRVRLRLQAEHLFPVGGMALPQADGQSPEELAVCDSVALFLDGARRVQPGFQVTVHNAADVVRICRAVDGLPLGILLAAAWAETLTPAEIAARLAHDLGQGLDLLAADWRDVPDRQRSMRAVFDHSWRLLAQREREILQSLSVFAGGFTSRAAKQVSSALARDLTALVHKSLLDRSPSGRYEMHELLRQYLAGRLAQSPPAEAAVRDRHGAHFARALARWANELKGERQEAALAEMDIEIQNAQAAWAWLVEQEQVEQLAGAVEGLCLFFEWRVRCRQGEAACRQAAGRLARIEPQTGSGLRLLARLLAWQSLFVHYLAGSERAGPLLRRSLAALADPTLAGQDTRAEQAHAWWCQGRLLVSRDREGARRAYARCLSLYQALDDRWGMANALAALGGVAWNLGNYRQARRRHEASLAMRQELGDKRGISNSLMSVGVTALYQGEVALAQELVQQGCALRREIGDRRGVADGLRHLGVTHLLAGEFAEAASLLEQCLEVYTDLGFRFGLEVAMLGDALLHAGDFAAGQARAAEALAIARGTGFRRGIGYALFVLGEADLARGAFGEAEAHLVDSVATYREIDQWDEHCRALAALAYARRGLGCQPWAPTGLLDGLRLAADRGAFLPLLWGLPVLTLLLADAGQATLAAELGAEAMGYPALARSRWFAAVMGQRLMVAAGAAPSSGEAHSLPALVARVLEDWG